MTKLFILLAVVGLAIWWLRRGRGGDERPPKTPKTPKGPKAGKGTRHDAPPEPTPMLACAHCGVHLPQADAVLDSAGRPYCGEAHRLAGPR
jgi:uncharacterized protein